MLQVHTCQTSEEQFAASFLGHLGPVYRVQESLFVPDLFLTASEDWTIRLWSKSKVSSLDILNFKCHPLFSSSRTRCPHFRKTA